MAKAFLNINFNNSSQSVTPATKFPKHRWLNHLLTRSGNDWTQVGQKYFRKFTSVFRDTLAMPPPACGHHRITSCGASTPDSVAYNNHPETPKLAQLRKKPLTWALAISSQLSNRLTGSFNLPLFGTKLHLKGAWWYPHNHKGEKQCMPEGHKNISCIVVSNGGLDKVTCLYLCVTLTF